MALRAADNPAIELEGYVKKREIYLNRNTPGLERINF